MTRIASATASHGQSVLFCSANQGFAPTPGGSQGNLRLSGTIGRFNKQTQRSGSGGAFTIQVDLANIPTSPTHTVLAGETWNFQAWFRDKNPANTSNFTDGISVTFSTDQFCLDLHAPVPTAPAHSWPPGPRPKRLAGPEGSQ